MVAYWFHIFSGFLSEFCVGYNRNTDFVLYTLHANEPRCTYSQKSCKTYQQAELTYRQMFPLMRTALYLFYTDVQVAVACSEGVYKRSPRILRYVHLAWYAEFKDDLLQWLSWCATVWTFPPSGHGVCLYRRMYPCPSGGKPCRRCTRTNKQSIEQEYVCVRSNHVLLPAWYL